MKILSNQPEEIKKILAKLRNQKRIIKNVYDLTEKKEFDLHSNFVIQIAENLLAVENRDFNIDSNNIKILEFLLLYFNENKAAENIFPKEDYKLHKQIMLVGDVGVGKTLLMEIFSQYLKLTENQHVYENISITELINYYKLNNHLDGYTFNRLSKSNTSITNAKNICLNDLGLKTYMHFGVDTKSFIDDFLYARYELYTKYNVKVHITTNLTVDDLKEMFNYRLIDRFKAYNIIDLEGESRRK